MSNFRTIVQAQKSEKKVTVGSGLFFMGSCFAENMGNFMLKNRFPVTINPHGVLYNPISLAQSLESIVDNNPVNETDLYYLNGSWHSFMHHGMFSHPNAEVVVSKINEATHQAHQAIQKSEFLVITFGTAYVFRHKELNNVVANCHKFSADNFDRYQLHVDEIVDQFKETVIRLRLLNPTLNIILTVSPVRHLKDGAPGNQLSKATLLLAQDKIVSLFDRVTYFPAYEIMMDDLRDYRFYDASMVQPSPVAIDYIWKQFSDAYFDDRAKSYLKQVKKVINARQHRKLGHDELAHKNFLEKTLEYLTSLMHKYPEVMLENDKNWFVEQLNLYK